jgi:sec-independent protein translocase protein TatA
MPSTLQPLIAIFGLGGPEIALILFLILLLFGAKRLPELARGFGKSIREFKKATSEVENDIRTAIDDPGQKPQSKPSDPAKPGSN